MAEELIEMDSAAVVKERKDLIEDVKQCIDDLNQWKVDKFMKDEERKEMER